MAKKVDYSIGIDLGTGSVGWAVIDENYKLLKLKGKDAWGAFLFDDAKTAADTRVKRAQRRRYERRAERIRLLQDLMSDMVLSVDDSFFIRLKDSYLRSKNTIDEYKRSNHYNLFEGEYTDKDYYRNFKTIYHLRNFLVNSTEKADPRLIYLALHHIIKYRGNFLYEGKKIDMSNGAMLKESLRTFFEMINEEYNIDFHYVDKINKFVDVLKDKKQSKKEKEKDLNKCFATDNTKKFVSAFVKAILGYTVNLADLLLLDEVLSDDGKNLTFSFLKSDYDETEGLLVSKADGRENILFAVKEIYYSILFENVMRGKSNISEAMIDKYKAHEKDLKELKLFIKECFPVEKDEKTGKINSEYSKMFRNKKGINYVNYIGSNNKNVHYEGKISYEIFEGKIKELLSKTEENYFGNEHRIYCLNAINSGEFLPKLNCVENAGIPYQMNEVELEAILNNQAKFYPTLKENMDKIKAVFAFKRPYYIGTLKGDFSWCKQTINEQVTPWNFYDLVKDEEMQEEFITRMTNHCCYFKDEESLPINSITYQANIVLNEINKLKFQDSKYPISKEQKQKLFALCCNQKKVTAKDIVALLKKDFNDTLTIENIYGLSDPTRITASMVGIVDFKRILKEDFDIAKLNCYEDTIRTLTIFTDLKARKKRISNQKINGKELYSEAQVSQLCKLSYKGWGRYSMKFLNGILSNDNCTIVQKLYEENYHINELVMDKEDRFGFKALLPVYEETIEKFDYKAHIEKLYCSPSVKKSIWNALKIIEEIEKIAKCPPTRIFIESTKTDDVKKATQSRVKRLSELYKSIKTHEYFNEDCSKVLENLESKDLTIDADKFYLWLIQLGRSMYSKEKIGLNEIKDCEIDHIVPRCYIKDDSFENRVLVKKNENQRKSDTLGLDTAVILNMQEFWKFLYDKEFIGSKKYNNLQRTEYSESEQIGFINRQLVETNQIVKETKNLLLKRYPNTTIQCVKAGMNSQIRARYREIGKEGFYKIRSLNNFHHAKDAYLTAVVGQFTSIACPMWGQNEENIRLKWKIKRDSNSSKNVRELVNKKYGLIIDLMDNYADIDVFTDGETGEVLWNETRYNNIFDTMQKNNCLVVKKKPLMANTEFYNQTIFGNNSGKSNLIPLKIKNGVEMPTYYGGYSNENAAYFAVVKAKVVKKKQECIEYKFMSIPVIVAWQDKGDLNKILDYFKKELKNENIEIVKIVRKYQKIIFDGQLCYIAAAAELNNAHELYVKPEYEKMLYLASKYNENKNNSAKSYRYIKEFESNQEEYSNIIKAFIKDYCYLIRKFMPLYENFAQKCENILEKYYDNMAIDEKIGFVNNMLKVSDTSAGRFDIPTELGGGSGMGRLRGKTIKPDEVVWIDQSCTGLYEKITEGIE